MEDSESDDVQEIVPSLIAPPKVKRGRPARNKEEKGFRDGQEIEKVVQPM